MPRNAVRVCVRTRPTHRFAQDNITIEQEQATIQVNSNRELESEAGGMLNNRQSTFKFKFDHVFHNASQAAVYDLFAHDIVQNSVDGINGAIMTYGQTGSGKTFTMMGDAHSYEHRGIAPKALGHIFSEVASRIEFEFKVTCTYMEIYNEKFFDLLQDLSNPDQAADYTIAEEKDGRGVFVRGLTEVEIKSESEALNLLFSGELARTTATHKLNKRSNRSHSVFTIYIQQRQRSGVSEKVVHSKLHLVDLAGSERLKKTMDGEDGVSSTDILKRESININQSLTYLEQCVIALSKKGSHVPYRQSKLTNVLKDALGANCNTLMLACIWGEADHLEETISTLRLASRMMKVQNEVVAVETVDPSTLIKKQAKLIKALKQELLMHDALVERTGVSYEPYTPEQQTGIQQMLERYIDATEFEEEDILNIRSFRQMLEVCKQFKKMVIASRLESLSGRNDIFANETSSRDAAQLMTAGGFGASTLDNTADSKFVDGYDPKSASRVGYIGEEKSGFSLGTASAESKPFKGVEGVERYADMKKSSANSFEFGSVDASFSPPRGSNQIDFLNDKSNSDSNAFFDGNNLQVDKFLRSDGTDIHQQFLTEKGRYKVIKTKVRDCGLLVNGNKELIDKLQRDLDLRKTSRIEMLKKSGMKQKDIEEIVDEEEFKIMGDLKEAKRAYKNGFDQLQKLRTDLAQIKSSVDAKKASLVAEFNTWNNSARNPRGLDKTGGFEREQFDILDDQEAFDRLEVERVLADDPNSLAFFQAQKTRRALVTQNATNIRTIQKNKRLA